MFTAVSDDDSWVIAVADGLGGHDRGDEASQAAVGGLPERIGSAADMAMVFAEANRRVLALSTSSQQKGYRERPRSIPMTTLCVAAWTPEGGLLIGWMGDTMPFAVWSGPDGYAGSCCGSPHRDPTGTSRFAWASRPRTRPKKRDWSRWRWPGCSRTLNFRTL